MNRLQLGQLALRTTRRDWRAGELRLLAAALVIAVAAISSVGFFVDRVRGGMDREAAQYLGGDAAVESDRPIDAAWPQRAQALGLATALAVTFPSMVRAEGATESTALVAVKAVSAGYPLRGALRIDEGHGEHAAQGIPAPGTVWVEPELLRGLDAALGASLHLGRLQLRIAATIAVEPDRRLQVLGFAPRVLINEADLAASGLVQPASRVTYRWAVAGEGTAVRALVRTLKPQLARGQRLESLEDGRPEVQRTVERAQRFLSLVALLTVLIAAVAVSSAARRFCARRLDACALMRCLGLAQNDIVLLFAGEFLVVGLLASVAGGLLGLGLHLVLMQLMSGLVQSAASWPGMLPGLQGLFCGLVLLLGFGLPPLEQLRRVAPLRVLRRDVGAPAARTLLAYGAGGAGFLALLLWTAGDVKLGLIVGAGFLGCLAVFAGAARLALRALQALRSGGAPRLPVAWRYAIAALQRRPGVSVAQIVALAIGLMAMLLLALVRGDLIEQWRNQAPPGAPNRFVINIQPDQAAEVTERLHRDGVADAALEPMVRGRLVAIDERPIGPQSYDDERTRGLVEREFNLSYRNEAPSHNQVTAGRWFGPDAAELSIEEGIAQRLHIVLGQKLRFDVAGQPVQATVTSLRKVNWDSMRVNFFVIMAPPLLRDMPQTLITSFHLDPPGPARPGGGAPDVVTDLVRRFPNLTVIDTDQLLAQVRAMVDQLIAAVQFLFVFALGAGVLVLYAALAASQEERQRESALLRALGASRRQLAAAQAAEMTLVGSLAGLLGAAGAVAIAWAMAHYAFEFPFHVPAWVGPAGLVAGVAAASAGGWLGLRRILAVPPLQSLRDA
jgi:putative ABC transport system permease protein